MKFAWSNKLSIGNKEIDSQHMKLIALTIDFQDACLSGSGHEREKVVFSELLDYARFHFEAEEKYMQETGFSDYISHKMEHQGFIDRVIMLYEKSSYSKEDISNELVQYLKNWIMIHISEKDTAISK